MRKELIAEYVTDFLWVFGLFIFVGCIVAMQLPHLSEVDLGAFKGCYQIDEVIFGIRCTPHSGLAGLAIQISLSLAFSYFTLPLTTLVVLLFAFHSASVSAYGGATLFVLLTFLLYSPFILPLFIRSR